MVEDKKSISEKRKLTLNIVDAGKNQKRPHCKHGPTLLLTKKIGSLEKRFLACSAYRDNKCPILKKPVDTEKFALDRRKIRKNLVRILKAPKEGRGYCLTCAELFLDSDYHKHVRHDILTKISMKHIRRPTLLLKASTQKEKEAQYFFSPKTIDYIVESLKELDFDRLILIGCPSIHEKIQCSKKALGMESVLLDIDQRYRQFYPRKQFVLFNMFNNFFFEGDDGQKKLDDFLENSPPGRLCILIDPPFGGLIQAIGQTLDKLHKRWLKMHRAHWNRAFVRRKINSNSYEMGLMLFLPYFSEPKVLSFIKGMRMTDYKVYYSNHSSYKKCTCKNKIGSAVRMFTNITPKLLKLPSDEGYKYCKPCQRYVSPENNHCAKCDSCTSKDGRPSKHCDKCKKCFKDTWTHCHSCGVCGLPVNHQHS